MAWEEEEDNDLSERFVYDDVAAVISFVKSWNGVPFTTAVSLIGYVAVLF